MAKYQKENDIFMYQNELFFDEDCKKNTYQHVIVFNSTLSREELTPILKNLGIIVGEWKEFQSITEVHFRNWSKE